MIAFRLFARVEMRRTYASEEQCGIPSSLAMRQPFHFRVSIQDETSLGSGCQHSATKIVEYSLVQPY